MILLHFEYKEYLGINGNKHKDTGNSRLDHFHVL